MLPPLKRILGKSPTPPESRSKGREPRSKGRMSRFSLSPSAKRSPVSTRSNSVSSQTSNPFESYDRELSADLIAQADEQEMQLRRLARLIQGNNGISIRTRSWRLRTFPQSFIASELITFLSLRLRCSRAEAVTVALQMQAHGFVTHVVDATKNIGDFGGFFKVLPNSQLESLLLPSELNDVYAKMRKVDGPRLSDRTYFKVLMRNCVTGTDVVSWLVAQKYAANRAHAQLVGQQLLRAGYLSHVTGRQPFLDADYFYQYRLYYRDYSMLDEAQVRSWLVSMRLKFAAPAPKLDPVLAAAAATGADAPALVVSKLDLVESISELSGRPAWWAISAAKLLHELGAVYREKAVRDRRQGGAAAASGVVGVREAKKLRRAVQAMSTGDSTHTAAKHHLSEMVTTERAIQAAARSAQQRFCVVPAHGEAAVFARLAARKKISADSAKMMRYLDVTSSAHLGWYVRSMIVRKFLYLALAVLLAVKVARLASGGYAPLNHMSYEALGVTHDSYATRVRPPPGLLSAADVGEWAPGYVDTLRDGLGGDFFAEVGGVYVAAQRAAPVECALSLVDGQACFSLDSFHTETLWLPAGEGTAALTNVSDVWFAPGLREFRAEATLYSPGLNVAAYWDTRVRLEPDDSLLVDVTADWLRVDDLPFSGLDDVLWACVGLLVVENVLTLWFRRSAALRSKPELMVFVCNAQLFWALLLQQRAHDILSVPSIAEHIDRRARIDMETVVQLVSTERILVSLSLLSAVLGFGKFYISHPLVRLLGRTLKRAEEQLNAVVVLLLLFTTGFCFMFYTFMSSSTAEFDSPLSTVLTLLTFQLGAIKVDFFREHATVLGTLGTVCYVIFFQFIVINILISVVMGTYRDVKDDYADAADQGLKHKNKDRLYEESGFGVVKACLVGVSSFLPVNLHEVTVNESLNHTALAMEALVNSMAGGGPRSRLPTEMGGDETPAAGHSPRDDGLKGLLGELRARVAESHLSSNSSSLQGSRQGSRSGSRAGSRSNSRPGSLMGSRSGSRKGSRRRVYAAGGGSGGSPTRSALASTSQSSSNSPSLTSSRPSANAPQPPDLDLALNADISSVHVHQTAAVYAEGLAQEIEDEANRSMQAARDSTASPAVPSDGDGESPGPEVHDASGAAIDV